jgi:PAS domain S-box-containing protein
MPQSQHNGKQEGGQDPTRLNADTLRLQDVFNAIQDGLSVLDRDFTIVRVNAWMEKMYAHKMPLTGKKCYEAYQGRSDVCPWCPSKPARDTGKKRHAEVPYPDARAPHGWIHLSAFPMKNDAGAVVGIIESVRDISAEKSAQEALTKSEQRLRHIIEHSTNVFYSHTPDNIITYFSPQVEELLGYTPDEAQGTWMQLVAESPRKRIAIERTAAAVRTGTRQPPYDLPLLHKDGSTVWVEVRETPVVEHGTTVAVVGSLTDITERKHAERQLAMERFRLEHILRGTNVGTWEWNVQTGETVFDERWAEIIGYTLEELSPVSIDTWLQHTHPEDLRESNRRLQRCFSGEHAFYECEVRMKHKDGHWVWVLDRGAVATWTEDGKPLRMYGTHQDMTERRHTEEALQKMQKLESLGTLAGGIAHDFNNLLGGIYGYIDMAAESTKEEEVAGHLEQSLATIDRARHLTQQLLTFARGGAPVKKRGPLTPFIQDTVRFALSGSACTPRFAVAGDLWQCAFDKNQIAQVIDNIVINAQQAMPGGGEVEIRANNRTIGEGAHPVLSPGSYVEIVIRDRGIGMPQEMLGRIFDPFYTTKTRGHGLGLATCHSIVKRHGGCIDVTSVQGTGSAFHVFLPATGHGDAVYESEPAVSHNGSGTILLMDDEEMIRDVAGLMLTRFGYDVQYARDGAGALERCKAEITAGRSFVAIILDLTVPGARGGMETIGDIRDVDPHVPVFVASGYADDPVMAAPQRYGFTAGIAKPFRSTELARLLQEYGRPEHPAGDV